MVRPECCFFKDSMLYLLDNQNNHHLIFEIMKRLNNIFAAIVFVLMLAVAGCRDKRELQEREARIAQLERICNALNKNISSLHTIVTALTADDYVTSFSTFKEGGDVVGWDLMFNIIGKVNLSTGVKGVSVTAPFIGILKDIDDNYYWTLEGEWLLNKGSKLKANGEDGIIPRLKTVKEAWYVSYDGGESWVSEIFNERAIDGDNLIILTHDEKNIYIEFLDNTSITLPRTKPTEDIGDELLPEGALKLGPMGIYLDSNTATTVVVAGAVRIDKIKRYSEYGFVYSLDETISKQEDIFIKISELSADYKFTKTVTGLPYNTTIYYTAYLLKDGVYTLGEVRSFTTDDVTIGIATVVSTSKDVTFTGNVVRKSEDEEVKVGIMCSTNEDFSSDLKSLEVVPLEDGSFVLTFSGFSPSQTYYYRTYTSQREVYQYGSIGSFTMPEFSYEEETDLDLNSATDLSATGTANSYIISQPGLYKFKAVKGNSEESVGAVVRAEMLWETFGTNVSPIKSDLVCAFCYKEGYIVFQANETYKKGNAVIAAKDAEGKTLWSWHLWYTDQPKGQIYFNDAGIMMDRNLGAISTTPKDVGAAGLLYQWGRKDPFLGSYALGHNSYTQARAFSTINWPPAVTSSLTTGTIEFSIANPTVFICYIHAGGSNYDWYYTGNRSTDNTRWQSSKTIYDPCPVGWRVPDGGKDGVWAKAAGLTFITIQGSFAFGMNFTGIFGEEEVIWYPNAGFVRGLEAFMFHDGTRGYYWSITPYDEKAYYLSIDTYYDRISITATTSRAEAFSVRCIKE